MRQGSFWRRRARSFAGAGTGLLHLLRHENSIHLHLVATVLVVLLGLWCGIGRGEWLVLVLAISLVWTAEACNTALELLADRISQEEDALLGKAKDCAAAAVLLSVCGALILGALVFLPYLTP